MDTLAALPFRLKLQFKMLDESEFGITQLGRVFQLYHGCLLDVGGKPI